MKKAHSKNSVAQDVWRKLGQRVKARNGTDEDLEHLATSQGESLLDEIAVWLETIGAMHRNLYPVKAHYRSFKDAIAAGGYDSVDSDITEESFWPGDEVVVDTNLVLCHPGFDIESDDLMRILDGTKLRPATLPELCGFSEKYPGIQCDELPIAALGSVWTHRFSRNQRVPCVRRFLDSRRYLDACLWHRKWPASFRFLAAQV